MEYKKTQYGPWHWLILTVFGIPLPCIWFPLPQGRDIFIAAYMTVCGTLLILFFIICFSKMTIRDDGESLAVDFGWNIFPAAIIPFLHYTIHYADIVSIEPGRMWIIDGWGVKYFPFRGWTYSIWGFDCVKLTLFGGKIIRLGTNDVENLTT